MDTGILSKAATITRGLTLDAVEATGSGHLGMPLGMAEVGAVLFGDQLRFDPSDWRWANRDRFVLSVGHGSMFLYSWLHLSGFDLSLDDLKGFRTMHSRTPGHPEFAEAAGVEATTGPLGQGVGNAVGMAISGKLAAAWYNTEAHTIFDGHVVCMAGDGCLQEGVAAEASAMAGHMGLDNLILIYDSNDVTLDAMAIETQSEDTAKRYEAYGWDTATIDGHDLHAFRDAFARAKTNDNGRPKLIIAKTVIGRGVPEVEGTSGAHGEGGGKYAEAARRALGLPDERYHVSEEVKRFFAARKEAHSKVRAKWDETFAAWKQANPQLAAQLEGSQKGERPSAEELLEAIPQFEAGSQMATRGAGGKILNALAKELPTLISGSADLHGSNKNYIEAVGDFTRISPSGRNFRFGIREHAMGAVLNGLAYDGLTIPSGATFLVFSDYLRPSIRLAALSKLPLFYIFTHDSVAVGQDGPTHEPVETVSALRVIPNLDVIRPADAEETAGAYAAAIARTDGPTAFTLTRQNVPMLDSIPVQTRREGVLKGGYIAKEETGELELILLATGSELQLALAAAEKLGVGVRVVSLPCFEIFERQSADYRAKVLPGTCRKRVAVEAGVSLAWYRYVGLDGKVVGIDRFGLSAPGKEVLEELGMTVEKVVATARELM